MPLPAKLGATHALAIKIVEGNPGSEKNVLHEFVKKGDTLPAKGIEKCRIAKDLRAGDAGFLDFEVFQMEPGVRDPKLNQHVGSFRIASIDFKEEI